jgi:predicted ATPase
MLKTFGPLCYNRTMHRVVPEFIIEKYRAGQFNGSFRAVGMFLDLSGFSTLTDALAKQGQYGAEILVGLMHNVFDPLVASVFEHGGRIVGFAGDGILAMFPIETDERSVALDALASAWWIQQTLASRPTQKTPFGSFSFSAKIGLSLGDVSWGILSSASQQESTYYFRGRAVDDSASAEHLARAGETHLSRSLTDVLQDDILVERGEAFDRLTGIRPQLPAPNPLKFPSFDADISRIFLPEIILNRDERGEFRQAVNLFMRFPDLPNEKLWDFVQTLFRLKDQYGGLINRLDFGDKGCNMLMLWGAPVAYENDIGRALNFLLDLKDSVDFPITTGVTYYLAHAGFLGGEIFECYTCYGWGVNLASRFMMSAPEGHTWIDERVARRIKNRFDFTYLGAQRFKGFDTEQKVYQLQRRKPHEDAPHQGELVGRAAELSRLTEFLGPLWQGKSAGLISIWGEAGIGKSRLVYELRVSPSLEHREALWAFCHSDQVLRHSFNPFRYWLLRYFGLTSEMGDELRKQAFNQKLDELLASLPDPELAADLGRVRTALGALLDLTWPDSFYEKLDAEGRYNNTLLALTSLLKAESLRQPVVIFIEDAQFLDEDSAAFLPRLKRALADYPVAIIVSARRSGTDSALESLSDAVIELGALSTQAMASLAEIYLGGEASPELVDFLQERSEGNPYFAEQILIYLQEERLLDTGEGGWRISRALRDASLPADIRALLMAHLDQLSGTVRDIIQTASVLGREFDSQTLAAVLGDGATLPDLLREAEQAEILSPVTQRRYTFRHGLLRDAAYSMQTRARRQELHAAVVDSLERLYVNEIEPHYGELAHHAERATLTDKALHYLPLAATQAMDAYQNAKAVDYLSRALSLIPEQELRTRFDLLRKRVEVLHRIGDRKMEIGDIETLDSLASLLGDLPFTARALLARANYCSATGDYTSAIRIAEDVIDLMKASSPEITLEAYSYLASSLFRLGRLDESLAKARSGLVLARQAGARRSEAQMLSGMGLISIEQNKILDAMGYLEQSIKIARQISDEVIEISALNNFGNAAASLGDYSMAYECYERSYRGFQTRGDRSGEGTMLNNLGWVAGMRGDFDAARSYQQQALKIAREVGNQHQEAYTLINLSALLGIQGDAVGARECAALGYDLCRKIGERSGEAWALLNLGHSYILTEDLDDAQAAYEQSLSIREEMRQSNLSAEALAGLIQIALFKDDLAALAERTESVLSIMDKDWEFSGAEDPLRVYFVCYQALRKMKDPRSRDVLKSAKRLLEAQVSKFKDESARRMYVENVPWRRAIYQTD